MKRILQAIAAIGVCLAVAVQPGPVRAQSQPVSYTLSIPSQVYLGSVITLELKIHIPDGVRINGLDVMLPFDPSLFLMNTEDIAVGSFLGGMDFAVYFDRIHLWGESLTAASGGTYMLLTVPVTVIGTSGVNTALKTHTNACYYVAAGMSDPIQSVSVTEGSADLLATEKPPIPTTITSHKYTVSNGMIGKIAEKTTVAQLLSGLNEGEFATVCTADGIPADSAALVGTGFTVRLMQENQSPRSWTVAVTGDISGDGAVTAVDYVNVKFSVLGKQSLSGVYAKAADANGDGRITAADYVLIKFHVLGKQGLVPQG